jgi:hypothetical protein
MILFKNKNSHLDYHCEKVGFKPFYRHVFQYYDTNEANNIDIYVQNMDKGEFENNKKDIEIINFKNYEISVMTLDDIIGRYYKSYENPSQERLKKSQTDIDRLQIVAGGVVKYKRKIEELIRKIKEEKRKIMSGGYKNKYLKYSHKNFQNGGDKEIKLKNA